MTKPALTPEEWVGGNVQLTDEGDGRCVQVYCGPGGEVGHTFDGGYEPFGNPHGVAALCLHGQPFGFTRDDVNALRDLPPVPWRYGGEGGVEAVEVWLRDLADRIEALLPPEGT